MRGRWRRWLTAVHRDLGYFFAGTVFVFSLSGIALNHKEDWDPSFIIERREIEVKLPADRRRIDRKAIEEVLDAGGIDDGYRAHDYPSASKLKVFTKKGALMVDLKRGTGEYEAARRRPVFYQVTFLHLDPGRWWTWYSDVFSVALIGITLSGLFLSRGKYGFRWRGAVVAGLGVLAPVVFLLVL